MPSPHPIQQAIKDYLNSHPWFAQPRPIPVFAQDEGDLENRVQAALGALDGGLAIVAAIPSGVNSDPHSPRVCLENIVELRTTELPLVNRASGGLGKTAYEVTRVLASPFYGARRGLHGWRPGAPNGALEFIEFVSTTDSENGTWLYAAKFSFKETL